MYNNPSLGFKKRVHQKYTKNVQCELQMGYRLSSHLSLWGRHSVEFPLACSFAFRCLHRSMVRPAVVFGVTCVAASSFDGTERLGYPHPLGPLSDLSDVSGAKGSN